MPDFLLLETGGSDNLLLESGDNLLLESSSAATFQSGWAIGSNVLIGLIAMQKNVSGQKIGAQLVSATDGSAFTGSVTVAVTGDAGTQATGSVGGGACTHEGNGYHTYAPAQAETNYDLIAFTFTGTGAVPVTVQVYTRHDANVTYLAGSATPVTNLNTIFNTDYATVYDTTNKAFLSKLGNFAMGGSSLALTTGAISGTTLTLSGAVAFQSTFAVTGTTTLTGAVTASNASNNIVGIDVAKISGDATAADNLELAFDGTGYGFANCTIPTVTTLTGHTAQTGDSYAIVNSGTHGNAAIKGYVDDIGTAGAGLTAVPWNAAWDAEVQSEVQDAIEANHLDHLIAVADPGGVVANSSFLAKLVSKSGTPAFTSFDNTTDSLEALRDRGDTAWTTATGFSTHTAADVWAVGARTLTAATNITSTGGTTVPQTGDSYARLGAPAGASVSADVAAVKTDTGNLITRITSTLFSGITSLASWLGALAGKTADSSTRTEINATTAGTGFNETTDSLEAQRDNIGTAGAALTAADDAVITAIGALNNLSSAQTQTAASAALTAYDPPTNAEMEARTLAAASYATATAVGVLFTTALTESYNTDGAAPTAAQALFAILQRLTEFSISGSTITVKKLDGSTTAFVLTLDSATSPTSSTRSS